MGYIIRSKHWTNLSYFKINIEKIGAICFPLIWEPLSDLKF